MSLVKQASLRQLSTFRTVARLGSVSMAADELHLSQSAVSIQLSNLEGCIGMPLVDRTGRGVRLTEAGEFLLGYANRINALWNETSDEMSSFLGAFSSVLRLGAVTTAEYWLPRALVLFVDQNPQVKIKLHVANRDEIVRSLAAQDIDIAVMGRPPEELKTSSSAIAGNPVAFVAAPSHPLLAIKPLELAHVAEHRLLVRERGSGTRTTVERLYRDAGLHLRIGSELSSNEAIKQMCAAGFGLAFLSLHTCVLEIEAGLLTVLPLPNNPIEREWFAVRMLSREQPQVAATFEQFLRVHGEGVIRDQLRPIAARPSRRARQHGDKRPLAA